MKGKGLLCADSQGQGPSSCSIGSKAKRALQETMGPHVGGLGGVAKNVSEIDELLPYMYGSRW